MHRTLSIATVGSVLILAGCGSQPLVDQKTDAPPSANDVKRPKTTSQLSPRRLTHVLTASVRLAVYDPKSSSYLNVRLPAGTKVGIGQHLGDEAYVTTQDGRSGKVPAGILREVWRVELPAEVAAVTKANNQFACDLYGQLRGGEGNLFFSPLSIHAALAMTYAGASGQTEADMAQTLHFTLPQQQLHPAYGQLQRSLQHDEQVSGFSLSVANRLWGKAGYEFVPQFRATIDTHYGGQLRTLDFSRPLQAAATINAWIEERTNRRIKDLVPPELIDPNTRLILTNAIYFRADWTEPFKVERTNPGPFHLLSGQTIETPLMHKQDRFRFRHADGFKLLDMPYGQEQLSMLVFLPDANDGLPALEAQLTEENLRRWHADLGQDSVEVALPRFKLESSFSLKETLSNLGMARAFEPHSDNFLGITSETPQWLVDVLHKAYVDVNEQGTEAAAATAAMMAAGSAPAPPPKFIADHPFVFLIRDNLSGAILFLGRVVDPRG